jgi:hypothetical protein
MMMFFKVISLRENETKRNYNHNSNWNFEDVQLFFFDDEEPLHGRATS